MVATSMTQGFGKEQLMIQTEDVAEAVRLLFDESERLLLYMGACCHTAHAPCLTDDEQSACRSSVQR